MTSALHGVCGLDFLWLGAGAWASRYLAAYGAEVIRIEWHEKHDFLRFYQPYLYPSDGYPVDPASPNRSGHFANLNAGKRGISLNVHHLRGKALFRQLLRTADVVAENFTATTMERWGLGCEAMRAVRPDLIYCQRSGFGSSYMDVMAPWLLAIAVMGALRYRDAAGLGQHIDLSIHGACSNQTEIHLLPHANLDDPHFRARGTFAEVLYPEVGHPLWNAGAAWWSSEMDWHAGRRAPRLGEHHRAVYVGDLGMAPGEIGRRTEAYLDRHPGSVGDVGDPGDPGRMALRPPSSVWERDDRCTPYSAASGRSRWRSWRRTWSASTWPTWART